MLPAPQVFTRDLYNTFFGKDGTPTPAGEALLKEPAFPYDKPTAPANIPAGRRCRLCHKPTAKTIHSHPENLENGALCTGFADCGYLSGKF